MGELATPGQERRRLPDTMEGCLQRGLVLRARELGWWGHEESYLLVRDGGSTALRVVLRKKRPDADLGFELSDELGIAVVKKVWPSSVAGTEGQLREGDVIRGVDGELRWTCEAVVRAIRQARGQVTLMVARGKRGLVSGAASTAPRRADVAASSGHYSWKADNFFVAAGDQHVVHILSAGPAVLRYEFKVQDYDICMHVQRGRGGRAGPSDGDSVPVLSVRDGKQSGDVRLGAGQHVVRWDNSFSYFRGKRLTFALSLLPEEEWAGEQRGEQRARLAVEVTTLKQLSKEAAERVARGESELAAVRKQATKLEKALGRSRREHEEQMERLREAKAELKRLHDDEQQPAGGGAVILDVGDSRSRSAV
tara:strand:+ start:726 stop:1823 length:1098 start_codon:yes stop_codon:yes gene_type:complete